MSETKSETKLKGKPNFCGEICEFCKKSHCASCYEGKTKSCWVCGERHYCDDCDDGTIPSSGTGKGDDTKSIFSVCTNCYCFCDHHGYPENIDRAKRAKSRGNCPYCEGSWEDLRLMSCDCDCRGKTVFTCLEHRPKNEDETEPDSSSDEEEETGCKDDCDDRHCQKCHKCMGMSDDHQMVCDMSMGVPINFSYYCMDHSS